MEELIKGKDILITGGTGSIGREIVHQVLKYKPRVVRIYSRDEQKQFDMSHELIEHKNIRFLIGDIRDMGRLRMAMTGIDIVFHAAAIKHVPFCEYNPFEAVKTNVIGTQNVIEAALDENVEKVVAISTDKVVNPFNTLGATKLVAEKLIAGANRYKGNRPIVFSCVRFGNVMGSRGSVIPLFIDQISKGGPVTVTNPKMTRFVMSIPQAVHLVLKAAEISKGGETFILKMPAMKIVDLVKVLIKEMAPRFGYDPKDIETKYIGSRPGEKMHEELLSPEEVNYTVETDDMFCVYPHAVNYEGENLSKPFRKGYSSHHGRLLNQREIRTLLHQEKVLWSRFDDEAQTWAQGINEAAASKELED